MDNSSLMNALTAKETLGLVSQMVGISSEDAGKAISSLLPALLNGAADQNKNADTAASFLEAVMSHGEKDSSDMSKFIKNIDLEDGAKIVGHLLGKDNEKAASAAAKASGIDKKKIIKLMAILAPIIMNQLGKESKKSGKKSSDDMGKLIGSLVKNIDVDDVLKIAKILMK